MSDEDLRRELAELRQKIEKLTATGVAASANSAAAGSTAAGKRPAVRRLLGELEELTSDFDSKSVDLGPITDRISALLRGLSSDMKNSEPRALLTSFLAGVLVGKLLSR